MTNHVPVTTFVAQALARHHDAAPAATLASEIVASTGMARGGSYFWDPLAAVAATRQDLVTTTTKRIDVITTGRATGRTITRTGATGETVVACTTPDAPRAWVVTSLPVFAASSRPQEGDRRRGRR